MASFNLQPPEYLQNKTFPLRERHVYLLQLYVNRFLYSVVVYIPFDADYWNLVAYSFQLPLPSIRRRWPSVQLLRKRSVPASSRQFGLKLVASDRSYKRTLIEFYAFILTFVDTPQSIGTTFFPPLLNCRRPCTTTPTTLP